MGIHIIVLVEKTVPRRAKLDDFRRGPFPDLERDCRFYCSILFSEYTLLNECQRPLVLS